MKPDAIKTAVIRTAVKKSISDLKADPGRGIRNLLDLGDMFSSGRYQHEFFGSVRDYLTDENGVYYKLIKRIVAQTDQEVFCRFGINLGYNALTHGAKIIHRIEEQESFNIPWCITIKFGRSISLGILGDIIQQGSELGIYCYIVCIDPSCAETGALLRLLAEQRDCAFILLTPADRITEKTCRIIGDGKNIMPLISLDGSPGQVFSLLRSEGCLYGVYSRDEKTDGLSDDKMQLADKYKASVFAEALPTDNAQGASEAEYRKILEIRKAPKYPVIPISLYHDIAYADRSISSEACLAFVGDDGVISLYNIDRGTDALMRRLDKKPLRELFAEALPKRAPLTNFS